ncbi:MULTISPECIES: FABP family protein [unclassified Leifsonia]|uniref:FABP family protein n=1 Tax=unclassified Leifsonia TaxID=2663824 RepID=UPI000A190386|nr:MULTISPECIES: FABP family protein [unclassified Leifsonia]QIZ99518.1 FABP family protein [Leifsonia sp. PS1209]
MIEIPTDLPAELVPLSWLIGVWEGTGVLDYAVGDDHTQLEFGQRVSFSHDGQPYLNYSSTSWVLDEGNTPLAAETGYWRLSRTLIEGDAGPAMLPGQGARPFSTAQSVETLRNSHGGFDIDVAIVHPDGVSELYLGQVNGPRIDLATDAVVRTAGAKDYTAATRLYGLVDNHLLWAWDIAALGQELRTHASARLAKAE